MKLSAAHASLKNFIRAFAVRLWPAAPAHFFRRSSMIFNYKRHGVEFIKPAVKVCALNLNGPADQHL